MQRTRDYRRRARAKAIKNKKAITKHNNWVYKHEGELSKGKVHCSCSICCQKSSKEYDRTSNSFGLLSKQDMISCINFKEQLVELQKSA